jgi:hypothetical protein
MAADRARVGRPQRTDRCGISGFFKVATARLARGCSSNRATDDIRPAARPCRLRRPGSPTPARPSVASRIVNILNPTCCWDPIRAITACSGRAPSARRRRSRTTAWSRAAGRAGVPKSVSALISSRSSARAASTTAASVALRMSMYRTCTTSWRDDIALCRRGAECGLASTRPRRSGDHSAGVRTRAAAAQRGTGRFQLPDASTVAGSSLHEPLHGNFEIAVARTVRSFRIARWETWR